jgi:dolichol-phosphate mannosyltransferase
MSVDLASMRNMFKFNYYILEDEMNTNPLISVVIPAYNESAGIKKFHNNLLMPHIKKVAKDSYEIIYVNDGSKDDTLNILSAIASKNQHVKVVALSRNFGKEVATSAGIEFASGKAIIIMDSDGQHPPALLHEFVDKWKAGAQVVVGVRASNQKEGAVKRWGSRLFYKLFNGVNGVKIIPGSTDYRLIDEAVRREFIKLPEHNRITRGLIDWLGFERDYIYFDSPGRLAGEATYSPSKLIGLAMNSFISLSPKPLFLLAWIGSTITFLSLIAGIFIFIEQLLLGDPLGLNFTGAALLGIFISFLIGLVLTSQGVLAVYISHIHTHGQGRPLFVVNYSRSTGIE